MTSAEIDSGSLNAPVTVVRGVGPARARALADAGVRSVGDLLRHLPTRYEDRRRVSRLGEISGAGGYSLRGRLTRLRPVHIRRRRLSMVRGTLLTEEGALDVVWFNRPYVRSQTDPETVYLVHGQMRQRGAGWELVNPSFEPEARARLSGSVVPVYSPLGKVTPSQVRMLMTHALDGLEQGSVADPLPRVLLERHDLPGLAEALRWLHAPDGDADVGALNEHSTSAHHRFVYQEALVLQMRLALARAAALQHRKPHRYDLAVAPSLAGLLPFSLTEAQARVLGEIHRDLESPYPMMRLLQGDVGCGKTAVAALSLALTAASGLQGALMAPTELLAEQHCEALSGVLGERFPVVLLTGSSAESESIRADLAGGQVSLVVGTHALIQESVHFDRLGLVIVDEQHRFGVGQRRGLQYKGERPDLLVMTATPIPRSLSLTLYGDLAVSVIDELPPGRQPIRTRVVPSDRRASVYSWVEGELASGAQAYVVLPLIEESEAVRAESLEGLGSELANRFGDFRTAMLHGRVAPEERRAVMQAFSSGEIDVLIATTLIEVGVDVPRASVMVIESAERFGLSQLHQLRGRVGRGSRRSTCVAVHGQVSADSQARLEVFGRTADGFEIAEADLELRGPGDVLGTRQSGAPRLQIINLVRDREWIERARSDAREWVESQPQSAVRLASAGESMAAYDRLAGG